MLKTPLDISKLVASGAVSFHPNKSAGNVSPKRIRQRPSQQTLGLCDLHRVLIALRPNETFFQAGRRLGYSAENIFKLRKFRKEEAA